MRDLGSKATNLGSAPLNEGADKLPDWPEWITSFQPLGGDPPGENEEFVAQYLMYVRLAHVLLSRDKKTLTEQTESIRDNEGPDVLVNMLEGLNMTRQIMTAYWCACEWALCRLSIVLGRNVLDDLPE